MSVGMVKNHNKYILVFFSQLLPSNYIFKYWFCSNDFSFLLQGLQLCKKGHLIKGLACITIVFGNPKYVVSYTLFKKISDLFFLLFFISCIFSIKSCIPCCVFYSICLHACSFQF